MHHCITATILLLLSSSAFSSPQIDYSITFDPPKAQQVLLTSAGPQDATTAITGVDHRTGCHNPSELGVIITRTNDDHEFNFLITTDYTMYYPDDLRAALRLDDFQIVLLSNEYACGWNKIKTAHSPAWWEVGHNRGTIYWKYHDLRWVEHPHGSSDMGHWAADSDDHIPPQFGPPRFNQLPSNATIDRLTRILEQNQPAADVLSVATEALTWICCFLCVVLFLLIFAFFVRSRAAQIETNDEEDGDAIELGSIHVHSTDKEGSFEQPGFSATAQHVPHVHNGCFGTSTPPPIYSVDGAGDARGGRSRQEHLPRHRERQSIRHSTLSTVLIAESSRNAVRSGGEATQGRSAGAPPTGANTGSSIYSVDSAGHRVMGDSSSETNRST
jgi:hypothetical protein